MKVLIRSAETAEYIGSQGSVMNPAEAHDFVKTEAAIGYCKENNLQNMEVVLRYENPTSEIAFPVL